MRKVLMVLAILLVASVGYTAPFLVCDPQAGVTNYVLTGPAWVPASVTAQTNGSLRLDVSAALVGANPMTVKSCITDAIWGEVCSTASPFAFTRPAPPATTSNIRLIQ